MKYIRLRINPPSKVISFKQNYVELQENPKPWGFVLAAKNIPGIIGHKILPTLQYNKCKSSLI